ncbi:MULTISPECIES: hypothetical protein [Paraburkholderia]|uniref:hypothetical protein n=1 Tax=Paraburkholderia TaxID=1822464 RepID=UPI0038B86360
MSDFEHFAAFFGNLIGKCRRHNGSWDRPPERSTPGVELHGGGTLRHPDKDAAGSGAVNAWGVRPTIAAPALARYYAPGSRVNGQLETCVDHDGQGGSDGWERVESMVNRSI